MTIIKSISGIRGTIGGKVNEGLTPVDTVIYAASYGSYLINKFPNKIINVVIGRDGRSSGQMIQNLVQNTLIGLGINCIDLGLSTTPTVEIAVMNENADGGIIISASHNPNNWNAFKLLNEKGEFIDNNSGKKIIELAEKNDFNFCKVENIGTIIENNSYVDIHIDKVLNLSCVNVKLIRNANFLVALDAVNSTGGIIIPRLLNKLGVKCIKLFCDINKDFPHNPEPLEENLSELSDTVINMKADFGISVDPDVDRLAFIDENGEMFGEEYSLVACADHILSKSPGNTVSNLSSTMALGILTKKYGGKYFSSSVGEVNVTELMKKKNAIIGGEGNGGIILPELHYGRDAVVGIAIFLSLLAERKIDVSKLKSTYPKFYISKNKMRLNDDINIDELINDIYKSYIKYDPILIDGVKINLKNSWIHLRKSNTEPIIRIYSEAETKKEADALSNKLIQEIKDKIN